MIPTEKDLMNKDKIVLYNNIAELGGNRGRLLAELQISPALRINWDFEILGETNGNLPFLLDPNPISTIQGHGFKIDKPHMDNWRTARGPLTAISGSTGQVLYNSLEFEAHSFTFYLPNARFQQATLNQIKLNKKIYEGEQEVSLSSYERKVDVRLDDFWSVSLETASDNLNWLDSKNYNLPNLGYKITTIGKLYQHNFTFNDLETFKILKLLKFTDAIRKIHNLAGILSFANSGWIGALYTEGEIYTENSNSPIEFVCATAMNYRTTPLEQLGSSWVNAHTDLAQYLSCLPNLEKMFQKPFWEQIFGELVTTYLQAAKDNQPGNVTAMMVGAALEKLGYAILVEDEIDPSLKAKHELLFGKDSKKAKAEWNLGDKAGQEDISVTNKRTTLLLERIGLTKAHGHSDVDEVPKFDTIRNDATHAKSGTTSSNERSRLMTLGLMWIEEALLWRLGYDGQYTDRRSEWVQGTAPRYDLSLRNPDW
jgi:hypothetical protein